VHFSRLSRSLLSLVSCVKFILQGNCFAAGLDDFQLHIFNYNTHERLSHSRPTHCAPNHEHHAHWEWWHVHQSPGLGQAVKMYSGALTQSTFRLIELMQGLWRSHPTSWTLFSIPKTQNQTSVRPHQIHCSWLILSSSASYLKIFSHTLTKSWSSHYPVCRLLVTVLVSFRYDMKSSPKMVKETNSIFWAECYFTVALLSRATGWSKFRVNNGAFKLDPWIKLHLLEGRSITPSALPITDPLPPHKHWQENISASQPWLPHEVTYYFRLYYSGTHKLHTLYTHQIFDFQGLTNLKIVQEGISDCQWITKTGSRQTTR
jgi:hypothetical protein